jgi:hypothetical protein
VKGLTAVLRVGTWLTHDGERFQIVELEGRRVLLRSATGELRQVDTAWLLTHPTTRFGAAQDPLEPSMAPAFTSLAGEQDAKLTTRIRHIQEVLTGYKLGSKDLAQDGEPREQYAPDTPKMARYQAKAAELGTSVMTVRRWVTGVHTRRPRRPAAQRQWSRNGRGGPRRSTLDRHVPCRAR